VDPGHRSLTLSIGPLRTGGADALVTDSVVPGVGNVIERLTDTVQASTQDSGEHLELCLAYPDA
jgi:serine/threonine-protein kinase RsbW